MELITIYYIIVLLVCIYIIMHTNSVSKTLAYILLIFALPVVGIIIYFAIGNNYRVNKLYQKKLEVNNTAYPELTKNLEFYNEETIDKYKEELDNFYNLAIFNKTNITSANNKHKILVNGECKFPEVLQSLRNAKNHIHIQYYIYEHDTIGTEIADILKQKVKEGVTVRFIYDDFGSNTIGKKFVKNLREAGIEIFPFYKLTLAKFGFRINYRNHRKIIVVDGIEGYVGGINVSDKYINANPPDKLFWRDTHLKITGISVLNLQFIFLTDWNFCAKQNVSFSEELFPIQLVTQPFGKQLIQIVPSGPDSDYPSILYSLMQAVYLAKKRILLTTPYFIPEPAFLDALKIAALSGIEVKLLVPGISDSRFVDIASRSNYEELLEVGVEIYQYQKGFVHAKTAVFDEYVSVIGTANLDQRSFDLNFEVNAILYNKKTANELAAIFYNDLESATKIDIEAWKNRSLFTKLLDRIVRLTGPLM